MSGGGFDAVDALLAGATEKQPLPPAEERRALREELGLSRAQVARALGVNPSTVGGWESGRDPVGETRGTYAYFLESARTKLAERKGRAQQEEAAQSPAPGPAPGPAPAPASEPVESSLPPVPAAPAPAVVERPCVLCGGPATEEVEGFPQHLDPQECAGAVQAQPVADAEPSAAPAPSAPSAPAPEVPASAPAAARARPRGRGAPSAQEVAPEAVLIDRAVERALAENGGDVDAATEQLVRRAIPDAMALLDECRKGGRYDVIAHPWVPDILRKQSAKGSDSIWEARPKWARPALPSGRHEVTALDINGAYLSALKTHLPIGQLEHSTGFGHDRRRAGVHLITPPDWEHEAYLPNPLGNRDEPGPLWVTEPTLRLLLRLSGPKYGLCEPPEIHESFTSGATENLLEKFRAALRDSRERALAAGDETTIEYVKAMYAKFVSTMGESNYNRELYRPDWMHLIRSQAFANLWMKAHRAYERGLSVVRVMGTDELHVTGDWRRVFAEGRGVLEVKVKDVYTVGDEGRGDGEEDLDA